MKVRTAQMPGFQVTASPLVLCDSLLSLAEEADHAGFRVTAEHLLELASSVLDCPPQRGPASHSKAANEVTARVV